MRGLHPIKFWSRTQASVSLSSAEAELTAIVKAGSESLGLKVLSSEMGVEVANITMLTDSSAANAMAHRLGSGRVKHVATQHLWIQEQVQRQNLCIRKVPRALNHAYLLTHHWSTGGGEKVLERMGMTFP